MQKRRNAAAAATPGYLDLPPELSDYATARVAVLPCPYDGTSTYGKGADKGPARLIEASTQVEFFDLELRRNPCEVGIATLPAVRFRSDDPEAAVNAIEKAAQRPVDDGKFLLGIGGEHTVSVGLTRAVRRKHGSFSVLHVDAHADLRADYHGTPYNHACAIHCLAEDDPDSIIVSIGIRAMCEEELAYAGRRGVHLFFGHELPRRKHWIRDAVKLLRDPVYVTIDLDGLDPSILPSTGTPVPGGVGWFDLLELLRRTGETKRVIACDVNELKPDPVNHHSEFLAAQLSYKMVGYFTCEQAVTPRAVKRGRRAGGSAAARGRA